MKSPKSSSKAVAPKTPAPDYSKAVLANVAWRESEKKTTPKTVSENPSSAKSAYKKK